MADVTRPQISPGDHQAYMEYALSQAQRSPPKPTNFCVGAVLVDAERNEILAAGFTQELPGNTHAEQCCFMKIAQKHGMAEDQIGSILPQRTVLYTTMEPCNKRSVGNKPCVERILDLSNAIKTVYVGVREPEKFVGENRGQARLQAAGIHVEHVAGLEDRILAVSTAGHEKV